MTERILIAFLLLAVPLGLLFREMKRVFAEERAKSKAPFTEKLLRPPGESLRLEIGRIEERMLDRSLPIFGLIIFPSIVIMVTELHLLSSKLLLYITFPAACYAVAIVHWRKFLGLRNDLRNCRLGFDGERYIGTELNQLFAAGYRVFHDFIFDMKPGGETTTFNIDHVAVGPAGVFAIETKTRRKSLIPGKSGHANYVVVSDGMRLTFSSGSPDEKPIRQAQSAAKDLSDWLTGSSEKAVDVMSDQLCRQVPANKNSTS